MDFTKCKTNQRAYGGANGSKIGIIYNNNNYLLKFPSRAKTNQNISYTNSCFSEDIGCKIIKSLGLDSQDTMLGTYKERIVVACKDFRKSNETFFDFASLKNSIVDSSSGGYDTDLTEVLNTIENQNTFNINPNETKKFFWEMFIADTLLGNFDRHNGNWGFLINEEEYICKIAPIYDCGSCLFPQADETLFKKVLNDVDEINMRVYTFPNSALKENGVKINPYIFLINTDNLDCLNALENITKNIDISKINKIVDDTPYITDLHKEFLKTMIAARKNKILDYALKNNNNFKNNSSFTQKIENIKSLGNDFEDIFAKEDSYNQSSKNIKRNKQ